MHPALEASPTPTHPRSSQSAELTSWLPRSSTSSSVLSSVCMSALISRHVPPRPSPSVSTCLFSTSASLFLPRKQVPLYHFPKYVLIYSICFQTTLPWKQNPLFLVSFLTRRQPSGLSGMRPRRACYINTSQEGFQFRHLCAAGNPGQTISPLGINTIRREWLQCGKAQILSPSFVHFNF